ncbi:imidazole glycerol phosphate synthase subunit HisH [Terrimonas pollutisoli]|uniref:imidazole glycerol phosphate synthase subunit HisH n=1 Tax=Terrimonas pollutisoli TaxID=3034147 RepID=UPI0023EE17D8|nr:imidazole glycerol phosphate synthase subunit HisH [Terrimonas sp. H1YJ31]
MSIVIIKYNAGNIQSVLYALERIGVEAIVTDDPDKIKAADKVIFPGVGEASTAMQYLRQRKLDILIKDLEQPVLGICLGMQLMCRYSEENDTDCLDIFDVTVKRFKTNDPSIKVPQIGWNNIYNLKTSLFESVPENSFIYSVHSYYAELCDETIATCNYIQPYSAGLKKNNFRGVQFHPEKSANIGEQILKNFLLA